jgi:hypothetical protein
MREQAFAFVDHRDGDARLSAAFTHGRVAFSFLHFLESFLRANRKDKIFY